MTDVHSPTQRSHNMSRIRSRNTRPEMIVRSAVHRMGCRYRLHDRSLPGSPDLVLPARGKIIFVNGCFWHLHNCRYGRVRPSTNAEFWEKKRSDTATRDRRNRQQLRKQGWQVLTVWECWTRSPDQKLMPQLEKFLID
ncbi:MAG: very short patch repair endonuclease [Planctomycetaceae bacterium]